MLAQQLSAEAADLAALELRLREAEQRPGDAAKDSSLCCEGQKEEGAWWIEVAGDAVGAGVKGGELVQAYRKRANVRRRAEASIRRAVDSNKLDKVTEDSNDKATCSTDHRNSEDKEGCEEAANSVLRQSDPIAHEHQITTDTTSTTKENALDPKTLTIDTLIAVRRAWDSYIVYPQTPGASTIPPVRQHFSIAPQLLQQMLTFELLCFNSISYLRHGHHPLNGPCMPRTHLAWGLQVKQIYE
ncbi:unnamed protein product [Phytophthora lilii]|uniref:Unnamed protein product n=1 Tax=Phytophthora lilii TaxID=2077276 RepID=A0A9W6WQN0_9STRA|nr:unnamed protein product [Phytophthora lilii]